MQLPFEDDQSIAEFFKGDDDLEHRKRGLARYLSMSVKAVKTATKYVSEIITRLFTHEYMSVHVASQA